MGKFTVAELVAGLREMADFYESHQDMPIPRLLIAHVGTQEREAFVAAIRNLADGGVVSKKTDDENSIMQEHHGIRMFGPIEVDVTIPKSLVCRKVRKMIETDVYECPDSMLAEVE